MSGNDLLLLGVVLGAVGSALWIKASLWPGKPERSSASYWGQNPYMLKAQILNRWEARFAGIWLLAGFVCSAVGTVRATTANNAADVLAAQWHVLPILWATGLVAGIASARIASHRARVEFRRWDASTAIRQLEKYIQEIRAGGYVPEEGIDTEQGAQERLHYIGNAIPEIGRQLEIPGRDGESNIEYAQRMVSELRRYAS